MKRAVPWFLIPLTLGLMLAVAHLPLPVRPYLDFQVIYHADMGLLRGIPLYDHAGQVNMIANLAGVQPEQVYVLPFPYPPWYALAALPLALLPIEVAARLWLELNIAILVLAVGLMTEAWKPLYRILSLLAALFFLPALGALLVGQYVFPALLGAALLTWSLRHERSVLAALAAALLTFKPHIGGLVILAALIHLWLRRDSYGRLTLRMIVLTGLALFALGFLADQAWPTSYLNSLLGFKGESECGQCISLPMALVSLGGWGLDQAIPVAGVLLIGLAGFLSGGRLRVWKEAEWIAPVSICVALSVSPYLQSYDFAFLLLPLFFLLDRARSWTIWVGVGLAYSLPWLRLGLPVDRGGDAVILASALLVTVLVFAGAARKMLDQPLRNMYNQQNSLREE